MTLALIPHNRLAAPTGSAPMSPLPPQPPSIYDSPTSFGDPGPVNRPPAYLVTAREHAARFGDSAVAIARLAQAEESATETVAAVATAEQALKLAMAWGDNTAAFAGAQLLLANGCAVAAYELLRSVEPATPLAEITGKVAVACRRFDDAERLLNGSDSLESLTLRGWLALERRRPQEAIRHLRRAVRLHGATPAVLTNIGFAHAQLGELTKAIRETTQALALAPGDHTIAFNLVTFQAATGSVAGAFAVLDGLEKIYPADIELALARADVFLRFGDRRSAHQVLQRARTSMGMASASSSARAELDANLAFLRWLTGRRDSVTTRQVVLEQLQLVDYQSLPIAGLLPPLLQQSADAELVESLVEHMEVLHPASDLFFLKVHHALVCRDVPRVVELAQAWVKHDPLNPLAASIAVQLTADLADDLPTAIEIGRRALRRAPADPALLNNVAYALARGGQLGEARELLKHVSFDNNVALTATRALIDLLSGSVEAGLEGYRRSQDLAFEQNNLTLAWLVQAYCTLALQQVDPQLPLSYGTTVPDRLILPANGEEDVNVWIVRQRVKREGLSLHMAAEDA